MCSQTAPQPLLLLLYFNQVHGLLHNHWPGQSSTALGGRQSQGWHPHLQVGKSRPKGEGLGPRSKQNPNVLIVGLEALFIAVSTPSVLQQLTAGPIPLGAEDRKESSGPRPCEKAGGSPPWIPAPPPIALGDLSGEWPDCHASAGVQTWTCLHVAPQRSGFKDENLYELGGGKVPGTPP